MYNAFLRTVLLFFFFFFYMREFGHYILFGASRTERMTVKLLFN